MSITKLSENLNNVSSLPDKPTLQANELKAIFDSSGNAIKNYINETLTEEIETELNAVKNSKTVVENNLISESSTNALSALQGKVLKENIDKKQKKITYGTQEPTGGENGDIYLQYFD